MPGISRNTDRLLTAEEQKFIRHYVRERDVEKAARKARLKAGQGASFFRRAHVREDIDRRLDVIEREQAKVDAQDIDRRLEMTEAYLDAELRRLIELDAKEHGHIKLKALGLGYVVRGKIRQGNTVVLAQAETVGETSVHIYRSAFEQRGAEPSQAAQLAASEEAAVAGASKDAAARKTVIRVY